MPYKSIVKYKIKIINAKIYKKKLNFYINIKTSYIAFLFLNSFSVK